MTKREINQVISEANSILAWAREFVRNSDMASAANQARTAQAACALIAIRCDEYAREKATE